MSNAVRANAEVARRDFTACVVSNSSYLEAHEASRALAAEEYRRTNDAGARRAQQLLLEYSGPAAYHFLALSASSRTSLCQDDKRSWMISQVAKDATNQYVFNVSGQVPELSRSAGGWFLLVTFSSLPPPQSPSPPPNDASSTVVSQIEKARSLGTWSVSTQLQITELERQCSDNEDAPTGTDDPDTLLSSQAMRDRSSGRCKEGAVTFCDGSFSSGRQVDECLVCGGDCFLPQCSADLGGCAASHASTHGTGTPRVRYAGEYSAPTWPWALESNFAKVSGAGMLTEPGAGRCSKEFKFDSPVPSDEACPPGSASGRDLLCEKLYCFLASGRELCRGRRESYRAHTSSLHIRSGDTFIFEDTTLLLEPLDDPRLFQLTIELIDIPSVQPPAPFPTPSNAETAETKRLLERPLTQQGRLQLPHLSAQDRNALKYQREASERRIRLVGSARQLQSALSILAVTAYQPQEPQPSSGLPAAPQVVLRFRFQERDSQGNEFTVSTRPLGRERSTGECVRPWIKFPECDVSRYPTDISLIFSPRDPDFRRVEKPRLCIPSHAHTRRRTCTHACTRACTYARAHARTRAHTFVALSAALSQVSTQRRPCRRYQHKYAHNLRALPWHVAREMRIMVLNSVAMHLCAFIHALSLSLSCCPLLLPLSLSHA